jgi:hypothetical protein
MKAPALEEAAKPDKKLHCWMMEKLSLHFWMMKKLSRKASKRK